MGVAEAILAIAPAVAKLIEVLTADEYDAEAERQALLEIQRLAAEARLKKALG